MKKISLALLFIPFLTIAQPTPGNPPAAPVDQYEVALIIAAIVLTLVVGFVASKKFKKA
ncbi:Uncharacterised protein [Candidatus Ornithobacterium hominis]|uniref:Uncharacterized protein n=1 Tax=Candidatus Ornithobacterium hominis TaxID=2497989 RepID=A0A383TYK5_9FLAO|nr:hypothetical protein [Candidatus Ornithobacterium hominis]MCT7904180.1 hypothetical protein [Candidatus Ornithobacterium hominis]SZD72279.1 Uncharacterised protein [Candidatus Ornithobacterium hominis]